MDFKGIDGIEKIETAGLAFGDYSAIIHGTVVPIVFERKSQQDLHGTLGKGHDRFKRELERAKQANFKLVLMIEGTYTDIWNGCEYSQIEGKTILKVLATMYTKYDLEYHFCETRRVMARRIVDTFSAIERSYKTEDAPF